MTIYQKRLCIPFLALLLLSGLSSCTGEKFYPVEDTEWQILVIWDGGPNVGQRVSFQEGSTITMVDDTATYGGTWSQSGQVVSWTVDIPDRALDCKATVDRKKIEGTLTDSNGGTAIMTGDRR